MKLIITLILISFTYLSAADLDFINTNSNITNSIQQDETLLRDYNKMILLSREVYQKVDPSNLPTMHMEAYIWSNHINEKCKLAESTCIKEEIDIRTEKLSVILKDDSW